MKKLALIGDSIRMIGYGTKVPEILKDEFETWQSDDNGRFSKYTLRYVSYEWVPKIEGSDVIHWNNGLWDVNDLGDGVFTSKEEYVENMTRIAKRLLAMGKRVIFATTTPVRPENVHNKNEVIEAYNAALVPKLVEMGVVINDLYTPLKTDVYRYICDDTIHLSEEGISLAADMVEAVIREEAAKITKSNADSTNDTNIDSIGAPV